MEMKGTIDTFHVEPPRSRTFQGRSRLQKTKDHLLQNMNDFSKYLTVDLESRRWIIRAIVMV
jgi:hypothetical protein